MGRLRGIRVAHGDLFLLFGHGLQKLLGRARGERNGGLSTGAMATRRIETGLEGHTVPALLELPEGAGPHPGVLGIHELWGLTGDMEGICGRLREAGYAAVAPELYGPGSRAGCIVRAIRDLARGGGELGTGRAAAALRRLGELPEVDASRTGVIGFCMGGGFALLLGARAEPAATSVNYGRVPEDLAQLEGSCPVVASYGGRDRQLLPHAERLRGFLETRGVENDVKLYPEAGHSFMNRSLPAVATRALRPLATLGYRADDAEDSWRRILGFFSRHLGGPAASSGPWPEALVPGLSAPVSPRAQHRAAAARGGRAGTSATAPRERPPPPS